MPARKILKHEKCGDGPVHEEHENDRVRVACCFCWDQTNLYATADRAWNAWEAGKIQSWNG